MKRNATVRLLSLAAYGYATRNWDALTKASVGRIYQHFQAAGHKNFAILSAHQARRGMTPEATQAANRTDTDKLKQDVTRLGYGHLPLLGFGQTRRGGEVSHEHSLFVPGMKAHEAVGLGKKYGQFSVLAAGPETGGKVHHIRTEDGGVQDVFDRLHPKAISMYYSRLRGGKGDAFTFGSSAAKDPDLKTDPRLQRSFGLHYPFGSIGESRCLVSTTRRLQARFAEPFADDWRYLEDLVDLGPR